MAFRKIINDGEGGQKYVTEQEEELEFDQVPTEGSFNPVTSGGVAKAIEETSDNITKLIPEGASEENKLVTESEFNEVTDVIPEDTTGENPLVNESGLETALSEVNTAVESIEGKIPQSASSSNKMVTEQDLQEAQGSWQSGFTPKGESTISALNGLTDQSNGDQYVVTDSGTLTDGSLAVTAGETVAWDGTNSVWYKVNNYALRQFGTDNVKNLPTSISQFRTGDVIPVDGPNGPAKMAMNNLLSETSQNAFEYAKQQSYFATRQALADETSRATQRENEIEALFVAPTEDAVAAWLESHPEATTTVQDGSLTEQKFTDALKLQTIKDYLTPQMFGAKGDGTTDDTEAFRNMFIAAKARAITGYNTFPGCYKVYVPCGVYRITDSVIYSAMSVAPAAFEIYGSGRDNTIIRYEGETNPLFNNSNIFAFTTFHDIGFIGNDTNTFMRLRDNGYGVQRINFNNCSFSNFCRIMEVSRSTTNLSECTFSWCKIYKCGTAETPCILFELNCPQLVNWRFIGTDIETFRGTAFYWVDGASVSISNASIIPMSGCVFKVLSNTTGYGYGNYPAIYCNAVRFELRNNSKLLESRAFRKSSLYDVSFYSVFICCNFNLGGGLIPDVFIDLVGAINIEFLYCTGLMYPNIKYTSIANEFANPVITLKGCRDVVPANWLTNAIISLSAYQPANAPEIIIDDRYDFFLNTGNFIEIFGSREVQVTFFYNKLGTLDIYAADVGTADEQYIIGYARVLRYSIKKRTDYGAVSLTISVLNSNNVVVGTAQVALSSGGSGEIPLDVFALKLKVKITNDANRLIQCYGTCRVVS